MISEDFMYRKLEQTDNLFIYKELRFYKVLPLDN